MAFNNINKISSYKDYVKTVKIHDKILLIYYGCGAHQHRAIGRFQACYDAPVEKFRKEYFSREEFVKWTGNYSLWASPWVGTNKPIKFVNTVAGFGDVSKEEAYVIEQCKQMPEGSYLITSSGSNHVLRHELIHALFYVLPEYKKEVLRIIDKYPEDAEFEYRGLKSMGYADMSLKDELNAYACGGGGYGAKQGTLHGELNHLTNEVIQATGIDLDKLMDLGSDLYEEEEL